MGGRFGLWSASDNCLSKHKDAATQMAIQQERLESAENIFSLIFGVLSFLLRTVGILVEFALIAYSIREIFGSYQSAQAWNDHLLLTNGCFLFLGFLLAWFGILPLLKYGSLGGFISLSFRIMGIFYGVVLGYIAGAVIIKSWERISAATQIFEALTVAYIPGGILFLSLFFVWFGLRPSANHA